MRNPLFSILVIFLLACIFLHYPQQISFANIEVDSLFGLERHTVERVLFLVPIAIGGILFGLKGGIAISVLALAVMLPRVFLLTPSSGEALFETGVVIATGGLINWQIESRRKQIGQREQMIIRLEAIRHELDSYVQIIRKNEKRLSIINSITTIINQSVTLEDIFSHVADRIGEELGTEAVFIYIINEQSQELELKVHRGVSTEFAQKVNRLEVGEGFNGWVAQTGEPYLIEDTLQDSRFNREVVKSEGLRSQFIVPLKSGEKIIGTFCIATHSIKDFTKDERELLMLVGAELGVAVDKARFYEESERIGKQFRELFEKANDAIWVHDFEGRTLAANQQSASLVGYEPKELIGKNVSTFLTPQGLQLAMEVKQKLMSREEMKQPYEQTVAKKDGTEAIIMLTTSLVDYEGTPAFQNIARDVTKERQLQENLRLYVHQITQAHEEERKRIARELHDDTIQSLIALSLRIDDLASSKPSQVKMTSQLEAIREELDKAMERMRLFIQDLRPPTLEYLGLVPALREVCSQLEQQAGVRAELRITGTEHHFAPEDELLIYRVAQEALRNIWKHSEATKAVVKVEFNNDKTIMAISDNGKGFEIDEDPGFIQAGKIGLAGMRERAALLGGTLVIRSGPGQGSKVVLEIPGDRLRSGHA